MGSGDERVWFERSPSGELRREIGADVIGLGPGTSEDPYEGIETARAVIASSLRYGGAVMDRAPDLEVIARTGIGYDGVDIEAATERGIAVCNAPDGPTTSTAEHTVALMFAAAKSLRASSMALRAGDPYPYGDHAAVELAGKTLGLVGFGRIARRVAAVGAALEMDVVAFDPYLAHDKFTVGRVSTLLGLLSQSNIVSVHVPLTPQTIAMFDDTAFARMQPGSIFVNAARGAVVDQDALLAALDSGRIFAAGLDVTDPEPLPLGHPLLTHDRVFITPHIASSTPEGRVRIFRTALDQVEKAMSGRKPEHKPEHIVNPEVWDRGRDRSEASA